MTRERHGLLAGLELHGQPDVGLDLPAACAAGSARTRLKNTSNERAPARVPETVTPAGKL